MTSALVTFVIPVYRPCAEWLCDAVASALGQRSVHVEVVVVDDGNEEPVEGVLARFDDRRLKVVRIEHGGVSAARNRGISVAAGTHLRFLDADDVAELDSTARLLTLTHRADGIGYGATAYCDAALNIGWVMRARQQGDVAIESMLGRFAVRAPSLVLPRWVVDAIGPWNTSLTVSEDWDYIQRALDHAPVRGEGAIATFYRRHPQSATADVGAGIAAARLVVERAFERRAEWRTPQLKRRAEAALAARAARVLSSNGSWLAAAPHVMRAARLDPGALAFEVRLGLPVLARRVIGRSPRRAADQVQPQL